MKVGGPISLEELKFVPYINVAAVNAPIRLVDSDGSEKSEGVENLVEEENDKEEQGEEEEESFEPSY